MASELKLSGSAAGRIIVQGNDTITTDQTFTFPDTGGEIATRTAGNILQVVQGSTSTQVEVSSTAFTSIGLQASITPTSTSSKILLLVSVQYQCFQNNDNAGHGIRVKRDSTVIRAPVQGSGGPYDVWLVVAGATNINYYDSFNYQILDAPSTTSSITYSIEGASYAGAGFVKYQAAATTQNQVSTLTLMEVAG